MQSSVNIGSPIFRTPSGMNIKGLLIEAQNVHDLIRYYGVSPRSLNILAESQIPERLRLIAGIEEVTDWDGLLSGENMPVNDTEQRVINYWRLLEYAGNMRGYDLSLDTLQQMHSLLTARLSYVEDPGSLRSQPGEKPGLPHPAELPALLEKLLEAANNRTESALIRAFYFYISFDLLQPFQDEYEEVGRAAAMMLLATEGMDFWGMINLDKHLFRRPELMGQISNLKDLPDYRLQLEADFRPAIHECLEGYNRAFAEVRDTIIRHIRDILGFADLNPRERNTLNFWLQRGFQMHKHKLAGLTPRQHDIMLLMVKFGSMATKDLVYHFQVDRKTIQRDFSILADLGLVEIRGAGRSLRYFLDMRIAL